MFTITFWKATGERAIRTFAQALVASLSVTTFVVTEGNSWVVAVTTAAFATLLSVLTSVAVAGVGPSGPSLGPESIDGPVDVAEVDVVEVDPDDPALAESLADPDDDEPAA